MSMDASLPILFVAGLGLLILGAQTLVRGASRLAVAIGISPLVVGLTVVAYGTSSPELAVGVATALTGRAEMALGTVVGSNIFNVLFILGGVALITPPIVAEELVRRDVPVMIGVSLLLAVLAFDGVIGRLDAAVLVTGAVAYAAGTVWQGRRESKQGHKLAAGESGDASPRGGTGLLLDIALMVIGLGLLVLGARWLVNGAIAVAHAFGLSELVIGLTLVAAGSGLPEAAIALVASLHGRRAIAVGNAVGSNIFNILGVLGITGLVAPRGITVAPGALTFDIPVMIGAAIAVLPIFFTGHRMERWEGGLFLSYYAAYIAYLVLRAVQHPALPAFGTAMLWFVIPLTAVTLLIQVARQVRGVRL